MAQHRVLFRGIIVGSIAGDVALTALAGCGTSKPPEPETAKSESVGKKEKAEKPTPISDKSVPNTSTASGINISDEILKKCGIPEPEAHFAFDSANLRPQDSAPLDKVAVCFISGPLKGRSLKLVGHADPRGDSEHNYQLGLSRANSVGTYLNGQGLDKAKTSTTSRGADEAKGTDEASWAVDRRVDVMLGD